MHTVTYAGLYAYDTNVHFKTRRPTVRVRFSHSRDDASIKSHSFPSSLGCLFDWLAVSVSVSVTSRCLKRLERKRPDKQIELVFGMEAFLHPSYTTL